MQIAYRCISLLNILTIFNCLPQFFSLLHRAVPVIARAKAWKCREVNHIIFVWYHAESAEPDWQPQPQTHISNGTWRYQGRNEFFINCHIQVCRIFDFPIDIKLLRHYFIYEGGRY